MNPVLAKAADRALGSALGRVVGTWDHVREALSPPPPVDHVRHGLIVKLWGLGNWALLRPVVRDLRERHPGARWTVVTLASNAPLVADLAERVLLVRPRRVGVLLADLARAVATLRRDPPDLSVDFEQFARAGALLARASRAAQRIGFRSGDAGRDGLYTALVPFRADVHAARSFRDLAEAAGVPRGDVRLGDLAPTPAGAREAEPFVAPGPFVVLHPGSGDNFPGRRWSEAGFAACARTARRRGFRVVVTGGPDEVALAERIAASAGEDGVVSAAGRLGVEGLVALLARACAVVSNDTAPVHLASQMGVPVLAFYGPNTPVLYGPASAGSRAFYKALPCSPCLLVANYRSSRCRIFTCMAGIGTGEVTAALDALLASRLAASPTLGASLGGPAVGPTPSEEHEMQGATTRRGAEVRREGATEQIGARSRPKPGGLPR